MKNMNFQERLPDLIGTQNSDEERMRLESGQVEDHYEVTDGLTTQYSRLDIFHCKYVPSAQCEFLK